MDRFVNGIEAVMHRAFCKNSYFVCSLDATLSRASRSEVARLRQKIIPPNGHHGVRVEMLVYFRDITETVYQPHDMGSLFPRGAFSANECKISREMLWKITKGSANLKRYFHITHSTW